MNNKLIKLHKGVDNQVRFKVTDPNRKPINIGHLAVRASLISSHTKERVLETYLKQSSEKGVLQLEVVEGQLKDIAPGFYKLFIVGEDSLTPTSDVSETISSPFYTNLQADITIPVEVVESAETIPAPTYTLDTWTPLLDSQDPTDIVYYTSAVPGNRIKNQINGVHTFSVHATNYTGVITVLGSLENSPVANPESDYFVVTLDDNSTSVTLTDYTGVLYFNFTHNLMWVKFKRNDDVANTGTLDKILFRS